MNHRALKRLKQLCEGWGGTLITYLPRDTIDQLDKGDEWHDSTTKKFYPAPFVSGYGIDWKRKVIYASRVGSEADELGPIIHEMGHVFACHEKPNQSDEFSWLGWEICVAYHVSCFREWDDQNGNYGLGQIPRVEASEWSQLSPAEKQMLIMDRIEHAKTLGIVDESNRPLAIR